METMTPTAIRTQLEAAQRTGNLIEGYDFNDAETFDVGFVIALDREFVLLMTLDWDGKINGLTAIRLTALHRVRAGTDYLTTVSLKAAVAEEHGYFDLWQVQQFLRQHNYRGRPLLRTLLVDSADHQLPLVIGTREYKGKDDFTGVIAALGKDELTLHYFNPHDLSSLWTYDIPLDQIDYLRVRGTQTATAQKILARVFQLGAGPHPVKEGE